MNRYKWRPTFSFWMRWTVCLETKVRHLRHTTFQGLQTAHMQHKNTILSKVFKTPHLLSKMFLIYKRNTTIYNQKYGPADW